MWLDENVLISDTNPNASYSASTYKNHYASIKVKVVGGVEYYSYPYVGEFYNADFYASNTDIMTLYITNDYTTLGENMFIKFEGSQKSVCAIINGNMECFKNNNYENEKAHLQSVFDEDDCYDHDAYYHCDDYAWDCDVDSDGNVVCYDYSSYDYCELNGDGSFGCYINSPQ